MINVPIAEREIRRAAMTSGHMIVPRIVIAVIRRVSIDGLQRGLFEKQERAGRRRQCGLGNAGVKTHGCSRLA